MNLQDYVRWRGDLTLAERPFNVIDNLALAAISYLNLAGIVPALASGETVSIQEAAERLEARRTLVTTDPALGFDERRLPIVDASVLTDLARSARFAKARLADFVDELDVTTGLQFAAVTIHLDDGSSYVSFRGTDVTILGWREDFTMSFETIPAQQAAARYLADHLAAAPAAVRVGGHSKGGNLAVFAAASLPDQELEQVLAVYDNDGPGFAPEVLEPGRLSRLEGRVVKIIPEFAVVGLLFDTAEKARIVRSDAPGILQHYITSWQVERDDIVEVDRIEPRAEIVKRAIDEWLEAVGPQERRVFTADFFDALSAGGATLISEVGDQDFGGFESVLYTFGRRRGRTGATVRLALRATARAVATLNYRAMLRRADVIRAILLAVVGFFFVVETPTAALVVSSVGLVALFVGIAAPLVLLLLRERAARPRSRRRTLGLLVVLVLASVLIVQLQVLIAPSNVLLGLLLVANAAYNANRGVALRRGPRRRLVRVGLRIASALASLALGVLVLSDARSVAPDLVLLTGQYLLVAGAVEAFIVLRDQVGERYASAAAVVGLRDAQRRWGSRSLLETDPSYTEHR